MAVHSLYSHPIAQEENNYSILRHIYLVIVYEELYMRKRVHFAFDSNNITTILTHQLLGAPQQLMGVPQQLLGAQQKLMRAPKKLKGSTTSAVGSVTAAAGSTAAAFESTTAAYQSTAAGAK